MKRSFLEVGDLPTDEYGVLYKLRPTLVRVFNTARATPRNMTLLKNTMKFMYNACVAFEKAQAAEVEAKQRQDLVNQLAELGVDADERKTIENLQADLEKAQAEQKEGK